MRIRTVIIIIGALILSGFVGWQVAGDTALDRQSRSDDWQSLIMHTTTHPDYRAISKQIIASGILPFEKTSTGQGNFRDTEFQLENSKRVPQFPSILATAIVDGVPQVTLSMEGQSIFTSRSGDILDNGWKIVEVDLTLVVASFDDESHEFPVLSYDRLGGNGQLIENGN